MKRIVGGHYRDQYFDKYLDFLGEKFDRERKADGKEIYSDVTIKTMATDTFYLEKHEPDDFGSWL